MYLLLLVCNVCVVLYVSCFNLDFEYTVTKTGPSDSLFGFSVAEHFDSRNKVNWMLVGAPKGNNTNLVSKFQETGTVYKCDPNELTNTCTEEVPFDKETKGLNYNKSNEWLGVSLKSGGEFNDVVACAHRYESYTDGGNFRLLEGICYLVAEDMRRPGNIYSPCYIENKEGGDHTTYGQCQSGIGLDISPIGYPKDDGDKPDTTMVIGAAGTKWWSGEFFEMDTEDKETNGQLPQKIQIEVQKEKSYSEYRSSYFGYSVTYGNFLMDNVAYIASGGPRHKHMGKVLVFPRTSEDGGKVYPTQELPPKESDIQLASGFGAALCSLDSDMDGLDELIVGAPFYLSLDGKDRAEQGIVYIYVKSNFKDELVLRGKLQGGKKAYARFGHSVANAGDINLDKFEDLVVGAPREDDGNGAVYLYHGSRLGLMEKMQQRIGASQIVSGLTENIGLQGFGFSLGTGVDMDNNGYKDVLVGAYLSNQVALLRSRPVVTVWSKLEFTPSNLDAAGDGCDLSKISTCTQAKLCFNISEPSGSFKATNEAVLVKYTIEADPIRESVRKSRMRFEATQNNKNSFISNTSSSYKCQELGLVSLVFNKDRSIVEYPDVMFKVSYEIPYEHPSFVKPDRTNDKVVSLQKYPILQHDTLMDGGKEGEVFMTADLGFKRDCTKCIPDLEVTTAKELHTVRLGKNTTTLDITIRNIGVDLAYSVSLELRLPSTLKLNDLKMEDKTKVSCRKGSNICQNMITRLNKGQSRKVSINLEVGAFAAHYDPKAVNNITILVNSANKEEVETTGNNKLSVTFDLKVEADLRINTIRATKSLTYEGEVKGESAMRSFEDAGQNVTHKYVVTNDGPDKLEMANLTIYWPYQTWTGKHLLYFVTLLGVKGDPDVKCEPETGNVLNLPSDRSGRRSAPSNIEIKVQDTKRAVAARRRVRREVDGGGGTTDGGDGATDAPILSSDEFPEVAEASRKYGTELNCTTAQCMEIKCTFLNLKAKDTKTVTVQSVLWEPSLLLDYATDIVTISSFGKVINGKNASYITDGNEYNQEAEIFTIVTPTKPPKRKGKVAVWQIALAVGAGVILLGLMIFGLFKVGFFRRTRTYEDNGADERLIKKAGR